MDSNTYKNGCHDKDAVVFNLKRINATELADILVRHAEALKQAGPHHTPEGVADFSGCLLENLDLSGRDLSLACFDDSVLAGCHLQGVRAKNASFKRARLMGNDTQGMELEHCAFDDAWMKGEINDAKITRCSFEDAVFRDAFFCNTEVDSCGFHFCPMEFCSVEGGSFVKCSFSDARMRSFSAFGTAFRDCHMQWLVANGCVFEGCSLSDCNLLDATFNECDMSGTLLKGCDTRGVVFRHKAGWAGMPQIEPSESCPDLVTFVERDFV